MKIEIEPEKCIASGQCVLVAEQVFDQDDDGIVVLHDAEPGDAAVEEAARNAARICPARAIHTHD